jgi:hypothetical protein
MNFSDKIVTSLPLESIWTEQNKIQAKRTSHLTSDSIKQLLNKTTVQFIVADIGHKLKWVDKSQCFDFWKNEVKTHLVSDPDNIELASYPDHYAYIASEWTGEIESPTILLEKVH